MDLPLKKVPFEVILAKASNPNLTNEQITRLTQEILGKNAVERFHRELEDNASPSGADMDSPDSEASETDILDPNWTRDKHQTEPVYDNEFYRNTANTEWNGSKG